MKPCACRECPKPAQEGREYCGWTCWAFNRDHPSEPHFHITPRTDLARAEVSYEAWREHGGPRSGAFAW